MLKARAHAKAKRDKAATHPAIVAIRHSLEESAQPAPIAPATADVFLQVRHDHIRPDPENARRNFDSAALTELAASIRDAGLLQPLIVGPAGPNGGHRLVAGERRWRAIGQLIADGVWADDRPIACRLFTAEGEAAMAAALIENLQRVDLNHMEAGEAFELLGSRFHLSNKVIAERIGRSPEFVQQHRRLVKLPEPARAQVRAGDMPMHEALEIVSRPTPDILGPVATLAFAEIWRRSHLKPLAAYNIATECAPTAASDNALKTLIDRRLVTFTERDPDKQRATIHVSWEGRRFAQNWFAGLEAKGPEGDQLLMPFLSAAGEKQFNCLSSEYDPAAIVRPRGVGGYATEWLNGPFFLTAEAQAEIDRRAEVTAKIKADQKARAAEEAEKNRERTAALEALLTDPDPRERLRQMLPAHGFVGPFAVAGDYSRQVIADGRRVLQPGYGIEHDLRDDAMAVMAVLLRWACAELGIPDAAPIVDEDEGPADDAPEVEPEVEPDVEEESAEPEPDDDEFPPYLQRLAGVQAPELEAAE